MMAILLQFLFLITGINHWSMASSIEDAGCPNSVCGTRGASLPPASCLDCDFPASCSRDQALPLNCSLPNCPAHSSHSSSSSPPPLRAVQLVARCRFCWQLDDSELDCDQHRNCSTNDVALHRTTCRAKPSVVCAGRRVFHKNVRCQWTSGHSWAKALFLSITLGGFGVDRFYLGHWKSAIGKLFSFGGLGLWTLLDIALIALGYIQPADESLYI